MPQTSSGPVLQLLASGLQRWVRSRCDSVDELSLALQGSAVELLRGRLKGVSLEARRVSFDQLPLMRAELQSGELKTLFRPGQPSQPVQLKEPFTIRGEVVLSGTDLNKALATDRWRWLADLLAEKLMGLSPLRSLEIDNDRLVLTAEVITGTKPVQGSFHLCADQGTIRLNNWEAEGEFLLPMDPSIRINDARLQGGQLVIKGDATVQP